MRRSVCYLIKLKQGNQPTLPFEPPVKRQRIPQLHMGHLISHSKLTRCHKKNWPELTWATMLSYRFSGSFVAVSTLQVVHFVGFLLPPHRNSRWCHQEYETLYFSKSPSLCQAIRPYRMPMPMPNVPPREREKVPRLTNEMPNKICLRLIHRAE